MDELYREAFRGPPAVVARNRGNALFGLSAGSLRVLGVLLLAVGILLGATGWYLWATFVPPGIFTNDFQSVDAAVSAA